MTAPHVVVVGAGIVGCMTSWRLATQGANVTLVDRSEIASVSSSSHGGTRIVRRALFEGPDYLPLIDRAWDLWNELGRIEPSVALRVTGGLTIGPADGALVNDAVAAVAIGAVPHELLDHATLSAQFPQHRLRDDDVAVFEPGAAVGVAQRSALAAWAEAQRLGARFVGGSQVIEIDTGPGCVVVRTPTATYRADAVVVAAGAGHNALLGGLGLPLEIERSMHVWFRGATPDRWSASAFPPFVRESGNLEGWGIGNLDGAGVKVGVSGLAKQVLSDVDEHYLAPQPLSELELEPVRRFVGDAIVDLDPNPIASQPCLNVVSPDDDFVIGLHPDIPNVAVVTAGSGHSFKHSPALGQIAADLALTGTTQTPIAAFALNRW